MEKSKTSNRYSPEMRARAVRMVLEHQGSYETLSAAGDFDYRAITAQWHADRAA